jgi:thioesterase domain-containing protein/acyl carrier protein
MRELRGYLSQRLPNYMVPAFIVELDEVPLTTNGKVDRKALPKPDKLLQVEEYVAPTTKLEEKLVEIWKDVFNLEQVGVTDNFFDVGGDSLKAILLSSRLGELFDKKLSNTILYRYQTIREIALNISNDNRAMKSIDYSNLSSGKNLNNVFCFPPISGYGTIFYNLAQLIKGYNLYSFNYINDSNKIQRYINQILEIQEKGPIVLLGYSAGCALAFEVAKELEKLGYKVSDLIMVDGAPRQKIRFLSEEKVEQLAKESVEIFLRFKDSYFSRIAKHELLEKIKNYHIYLNEVVNRGEVKATIHLIKSEEYSKQNTEWHKFTSQFFQHQGFGDHMEMLFYPDVRKNSTILESILVKTENFIKSLDNNKKQRI